jgi:hypothetical protein
MDRTGIINALIQTNKFISYLEIGLEQGYNFLRIECLHKESCDPYIVSELNTWGENTNVFNSEGDLIPEIQKILTFRMASDEMFAINNQKYDIIFIDGLHERHQVLRDIKNSLEHLNTGGFIIVHDCLPPREECQVVPRICAEWNGDVWKTFLLLRNQDVDFYVVDTDYGCGIVPYTDKKIKFTEFDFEYHSFFDDIEIRNKFLNVISVTKFKEMFTK